MMANNSSRWRCTTPPVATQTWRKASRFFLSIERNNKKSARLTTIFTNFKFTENSWCRALFIDGTVSRLTGLSKQIFPLRKREKITKLENRQLKKILSQFWTLSWSALENSIADIFGNKLIASLAFRRSWLPINNHHQLYAFSVLESTAKGVRMR